MGWFTRRRKVNIPRSSEPGIFSTRALARRSPVLRAVSRAWARVASAGTAIAGKLIARFVLPWQVDRPVYTEGDRWTIADQGYRRSSLIHACVVEFATSFAEPPFIAERYGQPLDPERDLLASLACQPNPELTAYEYRERIATDMKVYGEAFVWLRRSEAGLIRELWPLRVDRVEVIPDDDGSVLEYRTTDGISIMSTIDTVKPRDMMHIKYPNPLNDYRGLSPIFVLLTEGQLDKDAIKYLGDFFANGGLPSVVLTSANQLSDTERLDIGRQFDEQFSVRSGNAGGAFVLSNGGSIAAFGITPEKLQLSPIFDVAESRVTAVMGVPAILVGVMAGLKQAQAYGTAREARRGWWGETLVPFIERVDQIHDLRIAREFGRGYSWRSDLSQVQALLEAKSQVNRDAALLFSQNLMCRDEARLRLGLPPIDGKTPVYAWQLKPVSGAVSPGGDKSSIANRIEGASTPALTAGSGTPGNPPRPLLFPVTGGGTE